MVIKLSKNILFVCFLTILNLKSQIQNENKNMGGVNDSLKSKYDFFMETKSWGLASNINTSFKKQSTYVNLRYYFLEGMNDFPWFIEAESGYNFNKTWRNSLSFSFTNNKLSLLFIGTNFEHYHFNHLNQFFISPLIRLEFGAVGIEYSYKFPFESYRFNDIYNNNFSLIIRPRLLIQAFEKDDYSQYWKKKNKK